MEFYNKSIRECMSTLGSSEKGLSTVRAKEEMNRLKGLQIAQGKKRSVFLKFLAQFSDLMVLVLLISSIVSAIIGIVQGTKEELIDAGIIFGIVLMNAIFGLIQESKAEKSMEALKKMSEPESIVIRDGCAVKDLAKNLVPGDVVVFEAGAIVPADCRLIESANLSVDESSLTGESFPVGKEARIVLNENTPLAERKNMVYKGTTIANGRGVGLVVKIGKETELGKIATILNTSQKEMTPLQKSIKDVGKILTFLILLMAGVTFVLELIARGHPMEAFLTAVAISVAAIPESLPAVITIIMSLGISRLSKQKAIVRRMHSVETLGCCDFICSDKTGTITQNKMTVKSIYCDGKFTNKPNEKFLSTIVLCNDTIKGAKGYTGDPTELALTDYGIKFGIDKLQYDTMYERLDEISFDSKRKMMSVKVRFSNRDLVFCKGAVDILINKCDRILINDKIYPLDEKLRKNILKANESMSDRALRVLGLAYKEGRLEEENLVFVGLIGMIDPPRKEMVSAIKKCKKAGLTPVMITGDHKQTALAIAKEIGLADNDKQVMTGTEIDSLNDEDFLKIVEKIRVFARVSPDNKARIVESLKEKGHIVAMTGDGVNDAPSIKKASIGIGMGITGTDVTKEVSDMIITDDNFATIIVAVEEGRKVYSNIQKTVKFLFAANMGEILSLFIATLIFPQLIFLLPVQILFVNLITDTLPAIALGLEEGEKDIMDVPPRNKEEGLFSRGVGREIVTMGIVQTIIILVAYVIGLNFGGEYVGATMAFYTLNMIQLFYLIAVRSNHSIFKSNLLKNKLLIASLIFGFGIILIIALTPFGQILGLTKLNWLLWLITILLSLSIIPINEIYKLIRRKARKKLG